MERVNQKFTKQAAFFFSLMSEPLFTVYGFAPIILRKDLGGTAFQIALLTMLKPLVSILSFYWSSFFTKRSEALRKNFFWANLFSRVPFLLFPWVENSWFLVGASALYMLFSRAASPAYIEILRRNLSKEERNKVFSWSYALSYLEGMLLAIGVGLLLDRDPIFWKLLFFISAGIGILSLGIFKKVAIEESFEEEKKEGLTFKEHLIKPWKEGLSLMQTRPDFSRFQWGFMFAGFAIMLIQPALPLLFVDYLKISYVNFSLASLTCKGLFIALSSPFWGRLMTRYSIFQVSSLVFFLVALFPFFLFFSIGNMFWLYVAFAFYGIAQGGSHLVWHLSGAVFSGKKDSSVYTGINVMMIGVRGAIAPPLGSFFCILLGPFAVFFFSLFLCLMGVFVIQRKSSVEEIA